VNSTAEQGWTYTAGVFALGLLVIGASILSPWLALLLLAVIVGAWLALRFLVPLAFDVVGAILGAVAHVGTAALDASMAPERAALSGIHAEIALHQYLMRTRYPELYADVEKEMYERRSVHLERRPPFDHAGTLARYRARQDKLVRSAEPFIEELRRGNARHRLFDAVELADEERSIRKTRDELIAERRASVEAPPDRRASQQNPGGSWA
jgi:hypothetical protein